MSPLGDDDETACIQALPPHNHISHGMTGSAVNKEILSQEKIGLFMDMFRY